jgi:4-hydroxyacetophenone monooxygenase
MVALETETRAEFHSKTEAELRAALEKASPNALRMALYQATRDPELATMGVVKAPFWGGVFELSLLADDYVERVREKALAFLLSGGNDRAPPPSDAEMRQMMDIFAGHPVSDLAYSIGRGDLLDEDFPIGVEWSHEPPAEVKQKFKVVVIGAGLAGLASSIQLSRLGIPHVVVERNGGVGGTWWVNDYPEARVDIASHHYQYSFMKRYPWKHWFATQQELKEYAEEVVRRYDLGRNIRFNTELTGAKWDEASQAWQLTVKTAGAEEEKLTANALISAAGLFNSPNLPNIPGIETFQGKMFHTTQWDHSYDYRGKRVGQIGAGSTGAQLLPAIAAAAEHVTVFLRSPQWVSPIPGYRDAIPDDVQWLFDNFPHYWSWYCFSTFFTGMATDPEGVQNYDRDWQEAGGMVSKRNDGMRQYNMECMMAKVGHLPELVKKLTPDFPPMAKRPVVDNGWYDALLRDNVELVTGPLDRITPKGIRTPDGVEREFDLILLCAGFKTERFLWPVQYVGKGGVTLEQAWEKDGARAYLGLTAPGFPNLFMIYGPNAQARGGGLITWLEIWARYAVDSVVKLIETGHKSMDVKRDVFEKYNDEMDEKLKDCIWSSAESYYVNSQGRQNVNMPWKPVEYYEWVREPNLDDYNLG